MRGKCKNFIAAAIVSLGLVLLTACGSAIENASKNTVSVSRKGEVTQTIVEPFDETLYSVDELQTMIDDEIDRVTALYGGEITCGKIRTTKDGKIRLTMEFDTPEQFAGFNLCTFFYGTVEQARRSGYSIPDAAVLADPDGATPTEEMMLAAEERHVLISSEKSALITPYNISFATRGMRLSGKTGADPTSSLEDVIYIFMEK